jgi:RNA polymerase sigma factor (sigma-70 family)
MTYKAHEYAALEKEVKEGSKAAMGELIGRFGPSMERIAERLIGRLLQAHVDADDLVQAVQMTLWVGIRTGRFSVPTPDALLALTRTLLTRQVARHWRNVKMNDPNINAESGRVETLIDRNLFAAPEEDNPHATVEAADLLEEFLDLLDETDQRLLMLRIDGHRTSEVARTLQVDAGFLRVRLVRLRKKFSEFCPELCFQTFDARV